MARRAVASGPQRCGAGAQKGKQPAAPHTPRHPTPPSCRTFYRLYTAEGALLLALRFAHYRWTKQHYYLLDWCACVWLPAQQSDGGRDVDAAQQTESSCLPALRPQVLPGQRAPHFPCLVHAHQCASGQSHVWWVPPCCLGAGCRLGMMGDLGREGVGRLLDSRGGLALPARPPASKMALSAEAI